MRKRKEGRTQNPKTLNVAGKTKDDDDGNEIAAKEGKGFFACYLLTSLSPRHKGHTYIGFTVNPRRRIRQHNGEIRSGAWRTKSRRPWEMVLCIHGFPTNVSALQFEWAWQHPSESLAVRQAAAAFKSFSGVANKIKLAYTMLNLPAWQSLNLTVNYFSTKYTHHGAVCPSLPDHMKAHFTSMEDLPCYNKSDGSPSDDEDSFDAEEEDNGVPNLGKHGSTAHVMDDMLPNCLGTIEEISSAKVGLVSEHETEQQGTCDDSLAKVTSFCIEETDKDANLFDFIYEHSTELERQVGKEFTAPTNSGLEHEPETLEKQPRNVLAPAEDQSAHCFSMPNEVEIIDLLTPSPSCRAGSCSKKRRVPEIIDLTRSPNFIQL